VLVPAALCARQKPITILTKSLQRGERAVSARPSCCPSATSMSSGSEEQRRDAKKSLLKGSLGHAS
jgi:hypothetical protein